MEEDKILKALIKQQVIHKLREGLTIILLGQNLQVEVTVEQVHLRLERVRLQDLVLLLSLIRLRQAVKIILIEEVLELRLLQEQLHHPDQLILLLREVVLILVLVVLQEVLGLLQEALAHRPKVQVLHREVRVVGDSYLMFF